MTGQIVRPSKDLPGQNQFLTGHCPLTGRYLQPCSQLAEVLIKLREVLKENYTVQNICHKRNINNYALVTGHEIKVA